MHYRRADEIGAGTLMKQSNDMQKICQRYAKYMPKICQIYAKDMPQLCQRYAKDMPKI